MGASFGSLFGWRQQRAEVRVLLVGLDASGKTSVLHNFLGRPIIDPQPSSYQVEEFTHKGVQFSVCDVSGQDKYRRLWQHCFREKDTVCFVVDSADRDRIELARDELQAMLSHPDLQGAALLVLANKQDLPGCMSTAEVTDRLRLHSLAVSWYIQGTCALTGDGVCEGLDWMAALCSKD
eukprot:TRINITY_DN7275_c0_g1_i1.p1 TRINITY_DN7275_c0_g1~~TRINITY_DN7275_c0_g1_i1.p1  ORF type:complete len:195 (+),score=51.88 TRINITY_DN7275_c0_g1_i1:49-585(+)